MSLIAIAPWFAFALTVVGTMAGIGSFVGAHVARNAKQFDVALQAPPRRWHYVFLVAGFAAFALYGSLVPFQFQSLEFSEARRMFAGILHRDISIESRSDWLANVLLAVPLSYCALGALAVDRRGVARWGWQVPLVIAACTTFAAGLEFAQLWVPARTCSQNDIAAQSIGSAVGSGTWVLAGQRITNWVRQLTSVQDRVGARQRLVLLYCIVLFVYSLLPLDLTISPVEIYHKLRSGRVLFQPITANEFSVGKISETLTQALMFAMLGILVAGRNVDTGLRRSLFRAASWGCGLSIVIECAQLFVMSGSSKLSDVVLATMAAAIGAIVYVLMFNSENRILPRPSPLALRAWGWFAIAGIYAAMIFIIYTAPFEWLQNEARIAKRWHNLWNIPFGYSKYWSDPLDALKDVLCKLILWASLGGCLAKGFEQIFSLHAKNRSKFSEPTQRSSAGAVEDLRRGDQQGNECLRMGDSRPRDDTCSPACRRCLGCLFSVALTSAFSMIIEMLQVYLPPHVADVTDVVIAAFGGALGVAAALRF